MTISRLTPAVLCLAAVAAAAVPARAQYYGMIDPSATGATGNIEGFTVAGKATVAARPNAVEIDLEVSAASELTADAIVKYRDARRKLRDAFAALKLDGVAVEERGLVVDQKGMMNNPYFFNGFPQNTRAKTEVQLARKLVVKGSNIRKMEEDAVLQLVAKLLDVAQDAGARIGPQNEFNPYYYNPYDRMNTGLVRFVLDDFDKVEEEAYEKAIADARARAKRLAKLGNVELGPIVGVREIVVPGDRPPQGRDDVVMAHKRLETSKFQDIPVRVELQVRFDARPAAEARPKGAEK